MNTNELKLCPFCSIGNIAVESEEGELFHWFCWCDNCGARGPNNINDSGAIEMWNMRRPYTLLEIENKKLREAVKDLEELFEKECKK